MKIEFKYVIVLVFLIVSCKQSSDKVYIKDRANFSVGAAIETYNLENDSIYKNTIIKEFDRITPSNCLKMQKTYPAKDSFSFNEADSMIHFAQLNNIFVHAHCLIWHEALPSWFLNLNCDSAQFEKIVENYITTVVTHFKGRVVSWDVVNEAASDTGKEIMRNTIYLKRMGKNYMARCFKYAAKADPNAKLFYNEYGQEWVDSSKLYKTLAIVDDLIKQGVKIDGVGFQIHTQLGNPPLQNYQRMVDEVLKRKLLIHFSELDVTVNGEINKDGFLISFENDMAIAQKERYKSIVKIMKNIPSQYQWGITTWGVGDKDSWLRNFFVKNKKEWPLLFDDNYIRKPAYEGYLDALN